MSRTIDKKARFTEECAKRVALLSTGIDKLAFIAERDAGVYTEQNVDRIFKYLEKGMKIAKDKFREGLEPQKEPFKF